MSHEKLVKAKVTCDFCKEMCFIVDLAPGKEYWYPFGWWIVSMQSFEEDELVIQQLESCRECYEHHSDKWFKDNYYMQPANRLWPFGGPVGEDSES